MYQPFLAALQRILQRIQAQEVPDPSAGASAAYPGYSSQLRRQSPQYRAVSPPPVRPAVPYSPDEPLYQPRLVPPAKGGLEEPYPYYLQVRVTAAHSVW